MCLGCLVRWLYTSQRPVFPSSVDQYSTFIQNFSKNLWRKLNGINPPFNSTNNRSHIQSDALLVFLLHHIFLVSSKTVSAGKVRQQTALVPETPQAVIQPRVWGPSPTLRHLQTPHVERIESSFPTLCCLLSRWHKHLYSMSIFHGEPSASSQTQREYRRTTATVESAIILRLAVELPTINFGQALQYHQNI
ncbi:hypothetical protein PO909_004815 [Leuciscus waleckii]